MLSRRSVAFVGGLSLVLAGTTGTAIADDKTAGPLVQVSGTSPFLDCTADGIADQSGDVFLNSEVEPWIDVNPTDTDNLVGIWQQDRWSNGGARGLVAGVSHDGGASWQEVVIPGITLCSDGIYDRSTDPWVSFGPDGTLHQLALSFNDVASPFEPRDFDHALLGAVPAQEHEVQLAHPRRVGKDVRIAGVEEHLLDAIRIEVFQASGPGGRVAVPGLEDELAAVVQEQLVDAPMSTDAALDFQPEMARFDQDLAQAAGIEIIRSAAAYPRTWPLGQGWTVQVQAGDFLP